MNSRTVVAGRWVWADRDGVPTLLAEHAVLIEADRIVDVVPTAQVGADWGARIDVPNSLVLPGFVNAHAHVGSSPPLRGIPEDLPDVGVGGSALFQVTAPVSDLLYSDELADELTTFVEWDALAMLHSGVTTIVNETVAGFEHYVEVVLRLGLRTYVSPMFPAGNRARGYLQDGAIVYDPAASLQADLAQSLDNHRRFDGVGDGRVRVKLSPHAPDTVDPVMLAEVRRQADRLGCPITIHAAQSRVEVEQVRSRYGVGPIAHLFRVGLLGPNVLVTHASYPEPDDVALLREVGATVVHCPSRKAREALASPYLPYLEAGVRTALGTEAYTTDLFDDLRLAATLAKIAAGSIARPTARDVLISATRAGADALARPDLGRLAPGACADLAIISLASPHTWPVLDPLRSLVYYAHSADVDTVLVAGRPLLRDGRALTTDEDRLRERVANAAERLWSVARERGALDRLAGQ